MFWLRKPASVSVAVAPDDSIAPAELPIALDSEMFRRHFEALLAGAEQDGGIDGYLSALAAKRDVFAFAKTGGLKEISRLLELVFTARRKLYPALETLGGDFLDEIIRDLRQGKNPPGKRLQQFVDAMPGAAGNDRVSLKAAAKLRRAAWDFAAEILHFTDCERYPLMTRWVWDQGTQSGALREFIRGGEAMREVPFSNDPAIFEGARRWIGSRLVEQGIYRDEALWIDLVQAQAYLVYFRSMTEGSLGADFGRGVPPQEQLKRLLGIDAEPGMRHDRVKKPSSAQSMTEKIVH